MKVVYHNRRNLICLEQAMDSFDRFPRTIYDICEKDDVDILFRVVTNYRAHTCIMALFLREYDFPCIINTKLYPISEHMLPVILHMVEHLGSEEGCCQLWRKQSTRFHHTKKPIQIAGSNMRTSIG